MKLLRTSDMRLASIKRPGGWANDLDHGVVGGLIEQMQSGATLPPIKVRHDHVLVAGRHRLAAAEKLGRKSIRADVVRYASPDEAEADGLCENLRRRTLSVEERDRQVTRLAAIYRSMEPEGGFSARADQLREAPKGGRPASPERAVIRKTADAAGVSEDTVERAIKREHGRQQAAETPPANRDREAPIRSFGLPIAEHLRAEVEARQLHTDKADRLNQQLLTELTRMSAYDPESNPKSRELHALFRIAGAQLRLARPEWLCPYCKGQAELPCMSCSGRRWWDASQITSALPDELLLEGEQAHVVVDGRAPVPLAKWQARRAPNGEARGDHAR